jgi:hypothetical protein
VTYPWCASGMPERAARDPDDNRALPGGAPAR